MRSKQKSGFPFVGAQSRPALGLMFKEASISSARQLASPGHDGRAYDQVYMKALHQMMHRELLKKEDGSKSNYQEILVALRRWQGGKDPIAWLNSMRTTQELEKDLSTSRFSHPWVAQAALHLCLSHRDPVEFFLALTKFIDGKDKRFQDAAIFVLLKDRNLLEAAGASTEESAGMLLQKLKKPRMLEGEAGDWFSELGGALGPRMFEPWEREKIAVILMASRAADSNYFRTFGDTVESLLSAIKLKAITDAKELGIFYEEQIMNFTMRALAGNPARGKDQYASSKN